MSQVVGKVSKLNFGFDLACANVRLKNKETW